MARRIIMRPEVPDDLTVIVDYFDLHSEGAGDRFLQSVFRTFDELAEMPGKGSLKRFRRPRLEGMRSWWVPGFRKYLIYYQFTDQALTIFAVLHGARKVREILRKRV